MYITVFFLQCLWECDISTLVSLHQYIVGWGPPRGALCVWLSGCWVEKNLFWLAVLISCGGEKDSLWVWRTLVGPAADMSWFIQMTVKLEELVACLSPRLSSTPYQHSHKPEPQAPSSHVSHSRLTFHQQLWTAALTTMTTCIVANCPHPLQFILLSASLAASPVPMAMQKVFILCTGYKPHRHISTCISKMNGI